MMTADELIEKAVKLADDRLAHGKDVVGMVLLVIEPKPGTLEVEALEYNSPPHSIERRVQQTMIIMAIRLARKLNIFRGVTLLSEAWMLRGDKATQARLDQLKKEKRSFAAEPDRVDTLMILAYGQDERPRMVSWELGPGKKKGRRVRKRVTADTFTPEAFQWESWLAEGFHDAQEGTS